MGEIKGMGNKIGTWGERESFLIGWVSGSANHAVEKKSNRVGEK